MFKVALLGGVHPDNELNTQCELLAKKIMDRHWHVIVGVAAGPIAIFINTIFEFQDRRLTIELIKYSNSRYINNIKVDKLVVVDDVFERLRIFAKCDAYVIAGGELGATTELLVIWNFLLAQKILDKKIIIMGDRAIERANIIADSLKFSSEDYRLVLCPVRCHEEAVEILDFSLKAKQRIFSRPL